MFVAEVQRLAGDPALIVKLKQLEMMVLHQATDEACTILPMAERLGSVH